MNKLLSSVFFKFFLTLVSLTRCLLDLISLFVNVDGLWLRSPNVFLVMTFNIVIQKTKIFNVLKCLLKEGRKKE